MQKITYTNSRGQYIVLFEEPYRIKNIAGVSKTNVDNQMDKAPYQDGKTLLDSLFEERYIEIELGVFGNHQEEVYQYRKMLNTVCNPKLGLGLLRYEYDGGVLEIEAKPETAPFYPAGNRNRTFGFQKAIINMIAPDPFWFDIFETTEILAEVRPLFGFPLELTEEGVELGSFSDGEILIENIGDVATHLRIEFTGAVTNPKIENVTTGEFVELITPLLDGEVLIVTTAFGNKKAEIIKTDGMIENAFQYINLESTFFKLQPGDNLLKLTAASGSEEAELTITYRKRYVGI